MEKFITQFKEHISGVLRGNDRVMIKGYITEFYHNNNFYYFLNKEQVQLKDYKEYVLKITSKIKESIECTIKQTGCHYQYLRSSEISKEDIARDIIRESNIATGLVCVLSAVEPCLFTINKQASWKNIANTGNVNITTFITTIKNLA